MSMERETGRPKFDGRYLAYVEGVMGWLEPHIIVWTKNGWKYLHSSSEYDCEVLFWYGPLPVMSKAAWDEFTGRDINPPLEFDL